MARYYFSTILVEDFKMKTAILVLFISLTIFAIGKRHGFKKHDQFALNTSCFWESTGSNITPVVQFRKTFLTKIMNLLIYYYTSQSKNFIKLHNSKIIFFATTKIL